MSARSYPRTGTRSSLEVSVSPELRSALEVLTAKGYEREASPVVVRTMRSIVNLVRKTARANLAPHRQTGRMRDNVRTKYWGRGLRLIAGAKSTGAQSNMIAGGTRPHEIAGPVMPMWGGRGAFTSARTGLVRKGGAGLGIEGFARRVAHPGTPADPFFARALDSTEAERVHLLDAAAAQIAHDLAAAINGR